MLELYQLLGQSYGLAQLNGNAPAGVALLRDALAKSGRLRADAEQHRNRLSAVLEARGSACYVTRVSRDLLDAALSSLKE